MVMMMMTLITDMMICLYVYRGNFLPTISDDYIKKCNFDMVSNTYCPIFRVGDVVRYAQQNFTKLADKVESKDILKVFGENPTHVLVRKLQVKADDFLVSPY